MGRRERRERMADFREAQKLELPQKNRHCETDGDWKNSAPSLPVLKQGWRREGREVRVEATLEPLEA